MLAMLPMLHGFGLGVCINAAFMARSTCILVPQFSSEDVVKLIQVNGQLHCRSADLLRGAQPKNGIFQKADLSCFRATFSGADTLPRVVKEDFEAMVRQQGGNIQLREGYGFTEAVTAIMAMPMTEYREGSIGMPFPDMDAKLCAPGPSKGAPRGRGGNLRRRAGRDDGVPGPAGGNRPDN